MLLSCRLDEAPQPESVYGRQGLVLAQSLLAGGWYDNRLQAWCRAVKPRDHIFNCKSGPESKLGVGQYFPINVAKELHQLGPGVQMPCTCVCCSDSEHRLGSETPMYSRAIGRCLFFFFKPEVLGRQQVFRGAWEWSVVDTSALRWS